MLRSPDEYAELVLNAHRSGDGFGDPISVAFEDLALGKKRGHWIWYAFPQVHGLGESKMSQKYWVHVGADLAALIANHEIRSNLSKVFNLASTALLRRQQLGDSDGLATIFGGDVRKVVSSSMLIAGYLDWLPRESCTELHESARFLLEGRSPATSLCDKTEHFLAALG